MRSLPGKNILLFLEEETEITETPTPVKKGRNGELHARRNEKLADRYYFYRAIGKLDHPPVCEILSAEFDLSPWTIGEAVLEQTAYIRELRTVIKPTPRDLKKKWPYLDWSNLHPLTC